MPSELAANLKEFSGVQHGRICKEYNGRECEVQVEVPEWVRAIKGKAGFDREVERSETTDPCLSGAFEQRV